MGSTGFTNTILLDGFFILNKSSVFIQRNNSEILTDSSVIDFDFKNPITYQDSVFYYSGDLDNNGVIQEVYN